MSRRPQPLTRCVLTLAITCTLTLHGSSSAQPSPSPSPSTVEPTIRLLNPSAGYDPGLDPTGADDPPKLSDLLDADETYHVVAWQSDPRADEMVEASIRYPGGNEVTVGTLGRSAADPHVWEMSWDIPETLPDGEATFSVYLFGHTVDGIEQRAFDQTTVEVAHEDPDGVDPGDVEPAAQTVAMSWPTQAGPLGFYKPRGGTWSAVIDGIVSSEAARVSLAYSTSPPGAAPEFTPCGRVITSSLPGFGARPRAFQGTCSLGAGELPSKVTALAAVCEGSLADRSSGVLVQGAADVHVLRPYEQVPGDMTLALDRDHGRALADSCVSFVATVLDGLARPVQGANVDVHVSGPDDALQLGSGGSASKAPDDRTTHVVQPASNCSGAPAAHQGLHRVPGGADVKHRESFRGTGLDGPPGTSGVEPGQWRFTVYSPGPGGAGVTAWLDDEPLDGESTQRPVDDDTLEPAEPAASARAQWFVAMPVLSFDPPGASGAVGDCTRYLLKVRSGAAPLPEVNVDLHAATKLDGVRFCVPHDAEALRAPDEGPHHPVDASQSRDEVAGATTLHAETETNAAGNVVFGLTSPAPGEASLTAWIDGEPETDDDTMASVERRATATATWVDCAAGGHLSFVSPSAYGGATRGPGSGTALSTKTDADKAVHVIVRSDCASFVPSVEIQLARGSTFSPIGHATRVSGTDTYEMSWSGVPADGTYRLRAHAEGGGADEDQTVTVNATDFSGGDVTDQADETLEITKPGNGTPASFLRGATAVDGIASAGAEGVDLYYSKIDAGSTPVRADWTACGYVPLDGTGAAPQPFRGACALRAPDQPSEVTAVAALTLDCGIGRDGCDAAPDSGERDLLTFRKDSGDAHRVFGYEALPALTLTPAENESTVGACATFTVSLADHSGQAVVGDNVDVHLNGPDDGVAFCAPEGEASARPPAEGGHSLGHAGQSAHVEAAGADTYHVEGETDSRGLFTFGVQSDAPGDSGVVVWLDRVDDDFPASDDATDRSVMHWIAPRCSITGTDGADRLRGTAGADRMCGFGGNDTMFGLAGDDVLVGGRGADRVTGGPGDDVLRGGPGDDVLRGGDGRDRCTGRPPDRATTCESVDPVARSSRHV
jgi:hypothetical protein